jgi:hypothetical protein
MKIEQCIYYCGEQCIYYCGQIYLSWKDKCNIIITALAGEGFSYENEL